MTDNAMAYADVGWIVNTSEKGFYLMCASSRMQREVISHYQSSNIVVYDYSYKKKNYYFSDISQLIEKHPDAKCFFLVNLQLALSEENDFKRLNFSRDMLYRLNKNIVFCIIPSIKANFIKHTPDLYSYIKLNIEFSDELPAEHEMINVDSFARIDRSQGVEIEPDDTLPVDIRLANAIALTNKAEKLSSECRYHDALTLLLHVKDTREQTLGPQHPDTAETYNNLGSVYQDMGDYGKALEYHQKCLAVREKSLGTDHPRTAQSYNNLGLVYQDMGDYGKALEYHQKCLAVKEKSLGANHPDTATTYNNLGTVYQGMGDYEKALEYLQKSLVVIEKSLGADHPDASTSYSNLGTVYQGMGDYGKALEYYQKSLVVREKSFGTDHPRTAESYNNLGAVYRGMGDYEKALEYYEKAYEIFKSVLGDKHSYTTITHNNIVHLKKENDDNSVE